MARVALAGARMGASQLRRQPAEAAGGVVETLGTLRGLAAKVGQLASYIDGLAPETQTDAFQTALAKLRAAAPTSSPDQVREVVECDLGQPVELLFATWSAEPVASASIGQVHKATLHDGRDVAVKVQHPGIVRAVESDLSNAGMLRAILGGTVARHYHTRDLLEEARERFREELDYVLEAERQKHFNVLHESEPLIRVPAVIDDRSSARVLTSQWVSGGSFEEAVEAPMERRVMWAETLWRFVFRGALVGGVFNADPHPGNYLFHDDGSVTFIDFGCVQTMSKEHHEQAVWLHEAALRGDEEQFRKVAAAYLQASAGRHEELALAFVRRCFEPLFASPFHMTREWVTGLVQLFKESALEARRLAVKDVAPLPRGVLFMNRLQFGFYSVVARLDVPVDFANVERSFLSQAPYLSPSAAQSSLTV